MASKNVRITTLPPSLHFPWPLVRSTMLLLDEEKKKKKKKKKECFRDDYQLLRERKCVFSGLYFDLAGGNCEVGDRRRVEERS